MPSPYAVESGEARQGTGMWQDLLIWASRLDADPVPCGPFREHKPHALARPTCHGTLFVGLRKLDGDASRRGALIRCSRFDCHAIDVRLYGLNRAIKE
mmetsp:Transcript_59052/g.131633  ORF Transcript_59052/g.131633 Transcript_59052/m.131633 type:complete len:98 (+) Transcript_59052:287-580(+)